jgi:hypothetical protein
MNVTAAMIRRAKMSKQSRKEPTVRRPYNELTRYVNSQWKRWKALYIAGGVSVFAALGILAIYVGSEGWVNALIMSGNALWLVFTAVLVVSLFSELSSHNDRTDDLIDASIPWLRTKVETGEYDMYDIASIEQRAAIESSAVATRTIFEALALTLVAGWATQLPIDYVLIGVGAIVLLACKLIIELIFGSTASHVAAIMVEFSREQAKRQNQEQTPEPATANVPTLPTNEQIARNGAPSSSGKAGITVKAKEKPEVE